MNNFVCKCGNWIMAVPLQCTVVRPSLCAVYAQNWQIPNPATAVTHRNFFHSGRSLNTDWIRAKVKHDSRPHHASKSKNARAKSAASLRSASADFIETDDEIDDTVKEFKLTLQLFKRLTQQVRDVNQCMNQQRIYSFRHHMNNEGIASPALRRSQLAAAMSKREIPATEAPYEPCNDLGPVCTYLTRPCSRQDRETRVAPTSRPSSSAPPSRSSSPVLNTRPSSRSSTKRSAEKAADLKTVEEVEKADTEARKAWEATDPNFEELFVPDQLAPEDMDFRFHDPYPETWVDEVVEDACFRGAKKADPFMHRLAELENLEEETVLWEKYREDKARQLAEAANSKAMINKNSKQIITMPQNSRTQSAKVTAPHLYRAKTVVNKLRTYSAVKSSASNGAISASDEGSDSVQTFRNSGYKMGVSFIPGSLYPEARPTGKLRNNAQNAKTSKNAENVSRNASPSAHTVKKRTPSKQPSCEACTRTIPGQKPAGGIPRAVALSANVLRNQYELKSTECYDIVELAKTFDPPCKAQFVEAKVKKVASSADAALIKGLSPGKSYFSQRRVSLTQLVPDESMTVRGIGARNVTRPSTGRCKSVKRGPKRR